MCKYCIVTMDWASTPLRTSGPQLSRCPIHGDDASYVHTGHCYYYFRRAQNFTWTRK